MSSSDDLYDRLEITKMLTLSTCHLSLETMLRMNQAAEARTLGDGLENLPIFIKRDGASGQTGWFVYYPCYVGTWNPQEVILDERSMLSTIKDFPKDLLACIQLASENGCQSICFDVEANTAEGPEGRYPGLAIYDGEIPDCWDSKIQRITNEDVI